MFGLPGFGSFAIFCCAAEASHDGDGEVVGAVITITSTKERKRQKDCFIANQGKSPHTIEACLPVIHAVEV